MTIADWLIILTTFTGPIAAVQAQKWIERATERRSAQKRIFYTLMATRATRLAPDHVQALNMIDLEFSRSGVVKQTELERRVVDKWRIYAHHLNRNVDEANEAALTAWILQGDELFTDLLEALAAAMKYSFDRVQLRSGIYHPRGHSDAEIRRNVFEKALVSVLTGETSLPMRVTDFPYSPEASVLQKKVHEAFLSAVDADGTIKVKRPT